MCTRAVVASGVASRRGGSLLVHSRVMVSSDNRDREALMRSVRAYLSATQHLTQRTGLIEEIARAVYRQAMEQGAVGEQIATRRCLQDVKRTHSWALRQSIHEASSGNIDPVQR